MYEIKSVDHLDVFPFTVAFCVDGNLLTIIIIFKIINNNAFFISGSWFVSSDSSQSAEHGMIQHLFEKVFFNLLSNPWKPTKK